MRSVGPQYFILDQLENASNNLEMVSFFLHNMENEWKWKWAIIALHQALYGFAICSTLGTDPTWSLKEPSRPTNSNLISTWEAINRSKKKEWMPWGNSKPLETTLEEDLAIETLVTIFRNEFEHFRPRTWIIEVSGMPNIFKRVLRVIQFLALDSDCIFYSEIGQRIRIEKTLSTINLELRKISILHKQKQRSSKKHICNKRIKKKINRN